MLGSWGGYKFAHYARSIRADRVRRIAKMVKKGARLITYQGTISHELRDALVLPLVDLLL